MWGHNSVFFALLRVTSFRLISSQTERLEQEPIGSLHNDKYDKFIMISKIIINTAHELCQFFSHNMRLL